MRSVVDSEVVRERRVEGSGFEEVMNKLGDMINFGLSGRRMRLVG